MDQVKRIVAAGVELPTAIKSALKPLTVKAFAAKHELSEAVTCDVINLVRSPRAAVCVALAAELGGEPLAWATLLWEHAKPRPEAFARVA